MKAGSKFLNAVSAVALSAGVVASGAGVVTLASASVAEAAVIHNVDVRGASRTGADAVRDNITIKPGKDFTNADIDASVKQLYATGAVVQGSYQPLFSSFPFFAYVDERTCYLHILRVLIDIAYACDLCAIEIAVRIMV